jgi:hypothetical protein
MGGRLNRLNNAFWSGIFGGRGNGLSGTSTSDNIYGAAIIGGSGHTLNGNFDFMSGGRNNISKNNQPTTLSFNSIINGYNNSIGANGGRNTNLSQIIGGYDNTALNNGALTTIIGSHSSYTDGAAGNMFIANSTNSNCDGAAYGNIIGSANSTLQSNGYGGIYNSYDCDVLGYNGEYITITGSYNSKVGQSYPAPVGDYKGIYNAKDSVVYGGGDHHTLINGKTNTINSASGYNTIINGEQNIINDAGYATILGGIYNKITGATNYSSIVGGYENTNEGNYSGIFNGTLNRIKNSATEHSSILSSYSSTTEGDYSHVVGGIQNQALASQSVIVAGRDNLITAGSENSEMFGCRNSIISGSSVDTSFINTIETKSGGYDKITMIGTENRTATRDNAMFTENLVLFNYTGLNFADDSAAAAGGVVLGQVYHTAGAMKIRIV